MLSRDGKCIFSREFLSKSILILSCSFTLSNGNAIAQIIPDNSLGKENSIVTPDVTVKNQLVDLIEGGAIRGDNLFHSFEQFNIPDGGKVYFASPNSINNILTRITGNNISEIFGTLGVNGTANLFLLNPNGIIFGENASLDINGSFIATTADSYVFKNGFEYSASNTNTPPLLTVNIPIGLQMGNNSGNITVNGIGHSISRSNDFAPFINLDNSSGLRVKAEQTLALIGNQINLNGGKLVAPGGNIKLGSISEGLVEFDYKNGIDYKNVAQFQDITLSDRSLIETTGVISGSIELKGRNITLQNGSLLNSGNYVLFKENNLLFPQQSSIMEDTSQDVSLIQKDGVPLKTNKITVEATESLLITGISTNKIRSGIISQALGQYDGESIEIKTKNLTIVDGNIVSTTYNNHRGGDIDLQVADSLLISNSNLSISNSNTSNISSISFNRGNSGNITINAGKIEILKGAVIGSVTSSSGNAGDVTINATDLIEISGFNSNTFNSSNLSSFSFQSGDAGNLSVNTKSLIINDSGRISTATFASGNAGNVDINASNFVLVTGIAAGSPDPSLIDSAANLLDPIARENLNLSPFLTGNAGKVKINTPFLEVTDGGKITVRNDGFGDGGNIDINANQIVVNKDGNISASTESGNGGNIILQIEDILVLQNDSLISAKANNTGNGGNIWIDVGAAAILSQSSITADATAGNGGNINIATGGLFIDFNSSITASSEFGRTGNIEIETITSDRATELTKLPETSIDTTKQITTSCNFKSGFAIVGKGGLPENPQQYIRDTVVWQDLRFPKFSTDTSIPLPTFQYLKQKPIIEANNWQINKRGNIELIAKQNNNAFPYFYLYREKCLRNSSTS